jgi:hypothetical protein
MKRAPIALDNDDVIEFVLRKMLERLIQFQIFCPIGCFDGVHAHLLLRCPKRNPKIIMGIAKQYATAQLKAHGKAQGLALGFGEGIWAKNSSVKPITDEGHYKNSYGYIHKHSRRGAVVMIRDPDTTQLLRMQPTS